MQINHAMIPPGTLTMTKRVDLFSTPKDYRDKLALSEISLPSKTKRIVDSVYYLLVFSSTSLARSRMVTVGSTLNL